MPSDSGTRHSRIYTAGPSYPPPLPHTPYFVTVKDGFWNQDWFPHFPAFLSCIHHSKVVMHCCQNGNKFFVLPLYSHHCVTVHGNSISFLQLSLFQFFRNILLSAESYCLHNICVCLYQLLKVSQRRIPTVNTQTVTYGLVGGNQLCDNSLMYRQSLILNILPTIYLQLYTLTTVRWYFMMMN